MNTSIRSTGAAYVIPHPLGGFTIQPEGQSPCVGRWTKMGVAAEEAHKRYNIVFQCSIEGAFPTQPKPVFAS